MVHIHFDFDTSRPMDPSGWADYVAAFVLMGFYVITAFSVCITVKASTQARVSLAMKDPFWLNIMYLGSFASVTALFISNKHMDVLDPIRNFHCTTWDFWGMMGGIALWITFWIASLITSRIRQSGFSLTSTSHYEINEEDIVPTFSAEYDLREMQKATEGYTGTESHDDDGDDEEDLRRRRQDNMVAMVDAVEIDLTDNPENYQSTFHLDTTSGPNKQSFLCCCCCCTACSAIREHFSHWWWTRADIKTRLNIFRTLCCIVILGTFFVLCAVAEIPGIVSFVDEANACLTNVYYKIVVVAVMFVLLMVSWILLWKSSSKSKLMPTNTDGFLFISNYRNALAAMTGAMLLMVFMNMADLLSISLVRCIYFIIFVSLHVYGFYQMIGRTAYECLRGSYEYDRQLEEQLKRLDIPRSLKEIVSDSRYSDTLKEFYRYVRKTERDCMYLVDRKLLEYRPHSKVVVLPNYVSRWDPSKNRLADASRNYPLFMDYLVDFHEAMWNHRLELGKSFAETASGSPWGAGKIRDTYLRCIGSPPYETLCHNHPQSLATFRGKIPAIPMSDATFSNLDTKITLHPTDLALFRGVSEYVEEILQAICWTKYYKDGRTLRRFTEASMAQAEIAQSLPRTAAGSRLGVNTDDFGDVKIVDRQTMIEMPYSNFDTCMDARPDDIPPASFSIEDASDEEELY